MAARSLSSSGILGTMEGSALSIVTRSPVCSTLKRSVSLKLAVRCSRISVWTVRSLASSHSGVTTP